MREPVPVIVPTTTVNDEIVRLIAWHVRKGDPVDCDALLAEMETSKALVEIRASAPGYVWPRSGAGEDVRVGSLLAWITETPDAPPPDGSAPDASTAAADDPSAPASDAAPDADLPPARLTPQAMRLALELSVDPSSFPRGSLVRSADVRARAAAPAACVAPPGGTRACGDRPPLRRDALSRRKLAEVRVLAEGGRDALPASVSRAFAASEFRAALADRGLASSAAAILVQESARLLRQYPMFNAVFVDGSIGFYDEVNVGWATNDGAGLAVPVIARADLKTVDEIEAQLRACLAAYVQGRLPASALAGATFTISDLSSEGASAFVPLLSGGQSASLGVAADSLTLTFDHRIADGRDAARYLRDLVERLHAVERSGARPADPSATRDACYCARCGRDAAELESAGTVLLTCAIPKGQFVCGLCLAGY